MRLVLGVAIEKLSSAHVNARFRFFLDRVGMDNNNQGDLKLSIHSLRAGSAITKVLEGQSLKKVMYDAYWKNPATAWKYLKLFQVLFPFKDFGVQLSALSPEDYSLFNSTPLTQQSNWLQAFPGGGSMFDQSEFLLDALSESIGILVWGSAGRGISCGTLFIVLRSHLHSHSPYFRLKAYLVSYL